MRLRTLNKRDRLFKQKKLPVNGINGRARDEQAKFQTSRVLSQNFTSPNFFQDGYELVDLDATDRPSSRNWSHQASIRNINDEAVYLSASNVNSMPPYTGVLRTAISTSGAPRTFGARLQVNF